jgi:hypothetical protein
MAGVNAGTLRIQLFELSNFGYLSGWIWVEVLAYVCSVLYDAGSSMVDVTWDDKPVTPDCDPDLISDTRPSSFSSSRAVLDTAGRLGWRRRTVSAGRHSLFIRWHLTTSVVISRKFYLAQFFRPLARSTNSADDTLAFGLRTVCTGMAIWCRSTRSRRCMPPHA